MGSRGTPHRSGLRKTGPLSPALLVAAGLALSPGSAAAPLEGPAPEIDRPLVREFASHVGALAAGGTPMPSTPDLGVIVQLRGEIVALDFGRGRVTVQANGRSHQLRATPGQLADLTPGQIVDLRFGEFGDERWVLLDGERDLLEGFGRYGTTSSVVTSVDKARGLLVLGGRVHHCHPSMLEGVIPGQLLAVDYARVEGRRWVRSLVPQSP